MTSQSTPVLDLGWCLTALEEVNKKVAACFKATPKEVIFHFVDEIKCDLKQFKGRKGYMVGLADCDTNEIFLLPHIGWQETAVHELVHIYDPYLNERQTLKATRDAVMYLRSFK